MRKENWIMSSAAHCEDSESLHYEELNVIGTGAYGTVYRAKDNQSGKIVAIKKVRIPITDNGVPMSTLREIALLKHLNASDHPNIVKLFEVCQVLEREDQLMVLLVFEHLEQDLSDLIERLPKSGMPPVTIQRLSCELLTGVDFLHSHRIIHRDLKPQNLLISSQGHLKIADFGLAKTYDFEMKLTSVVVTLWYRAPEVLLAQSYNSSVDIWSVACIIAEMFSRKALFPGTSEANQLDRVFELTGRPTSQQWPQSISLSREHFPPRLPKQPKELCSNLCDYSNDLLSQMLSYDFRSRPSALACLKHEYFKQEPI
ncbi:cyclin-dependent kinase 4 [Bactrocera dorsalis]|uniref:cyclin-dependent kinase n=1 Tax=Bactrocera dorsalis TaxID=27457 RepID=A0A034WGA6_BACDO|nr:cyclin-dependent kinase 4 [Bactrocera dorsalis]XP_029408590.1 cyclin-dependent kinase 4 [Bactrocera dorsalis]XP_029408593.1 cyclin-dependent kinase 4 [Bactrocera dorsalis]XP_029408594.1 cyclin-dependent kinase 4 [Bactrocera dorsalis]XP_029408595.1 cyclin-dependent kinase 4 [Bactrocera dorsalis]XP_049308868.1 cyclin-dependent kinase 4 [Bactrocera dorsalis]